MPSPDRVALAHAHERLAARVRRIRLMRQRIVAGTLAAFVLAWGVVSFDGSMGAPISSATAQVTSATPTSSPDTSTDDSSSSDDSAATMTTRQS